MSSGRISAGKQLAPVTAGGPARFVVIQSLETYPITAICAALDRGTNEEVTLFLLRSPFGRPSSRFVAEFHKRQQIRHPALLPLIDYFYDEAEQTLGVVTTRLTGLSLRHELRGRAKLKASFQPAELADTLDALLRACECSHARGIRSVLPFVAEFIWVEQLESGRNIRLLDPGFAHLGSPLQMSGLATVAAWGNVLSPGVTLSDEVLDHRADQYCIASIGLMLLGCVPLEEFTSPIRV